MAVCFFMVFGALLEYAMVGYTGKRIKLQQRRFQEFKQKVQKMREEIEKRKEQDSMQTFQTVLI